MRIFFTGIRIIKAITTIDTTYEQHKAENIAAFFDKLKTYEVDHDDASIFRVVDWLDLSMDLENRHWLLIPIGEI